MLYGILSLTLDFKRLSRRVDIVIRVHLFDKLIYGGILRQQQPPGNCTVENEIRALIGF
jgi:hypothetical protein